MQNEEFQRIVLEKLGGLDIIGQRLDDIEKDLEAIKRDLNGVREQTAFLTEFKTVISEGGKA